jgi:SH3-like domain-containing protein
MLKACSLALLALAGPLMIPGAALPLMAADAAQEQSQAVTTTMSKRGNVRFGPSTQAKTITTLEPGAPVEVLGVAQGMPEWYVIRFPREGSAWIHEKVIRPDASGKKAKVIEDRARVRDDARQGSNIVAELALGEEVEIKERAHVGAWVPVYPPSAVGYVHKSVLVIPQGPGQPALPQAEEKPNKLDAVNDEALARYAAFKKALDEDPEIAARLDWDYLDMQLGQVADGHPNARIQAAASRLKARIQPVVDAVRRVQRDRGITPMRDVPNAPPITKKDPLPPTSDQPKDPPKDPGTKLPIDPLPKPADVEKVKNEGKGLPAAVQFAAQGFLEERAVPAVGTSHVIIDKNGKICAFVKTKPGVDLQLSEFFWRLVGVKGDSQMIEPDKHGQGGGPIPLVLVEDVALLQ